MHLPFYKYQILFLWKPDNLCWKNHPMDQIQPYTFPDKKCDIHGQKSPTFTQIMKANNQIVKLFSIGGNKRIKNENIFNKK